MLIVKKMGLGRKAKAAEHITANDERKLVGSEILSDIFLLAVNLLPQTCHKNFSKAN